MRPHALRSLVTVCALALACVALASPNAGAAPTSHSHNPFGRYALLSNTFPPDPPTVVGFVDLQVAKHTVAAVVTLTKGLAPGDYDVNAVSSNIEDIFSPRVKRICTATVNASGAGTCANKVHGNVLSRDVDVAAINVTPVGGDINMPVAVALLRFRA
jgi:hypothetical protein